MATATTAMSWLIANRVAPALEPYRWYSNGERGHLHSYRYCDKLARATNIVTRELTYTEASAKTVCEECLGYRFDGTETPRLLNQAMMIEKHEHMFADRLIASVPAEGPRRALRSRNAQAALEQLLASLALPELPTELSPQVDDLRRRINEAVGSIYVDSTELEADCREYAAVNLFDHELRTTASESIPRWGGEATVNIIGGIGYSTNRHALAFAVRHEIMRCIDLRAGKAASLAALNLDEMLENAPNLDVLRACHPNEEAREGESLYDFATRTWRAQARAAIIDLAGTWFDAIEKLAQADDWFLLPTRDFSRADLMRSIDHRATDPTVIASFQWTTRGRYSAVLVPTPVARWASTVRSVTRSSFEEPVQVPTSITVEQIDTALALWEPYARDHYQLFQDAVAAGLRV